MFFSDLAVQQMVFSTFQRFFDYLPTLTESWNDLMSGQFKLTKQQAAVYILSTKAWKTFCASVLTGGNGYGEDGMTLVRSLFDTTVTAVYLARHEDEVDDYLDFYWIHQRSRYNAIKAADPEWARRLYKVEMVKQIETKAKKIEDRFKRSDDKIRKTWYKEKNLEQLAIETGLRDQYDTIYRFGSDFSHPNFLGSHHILS